MTMTISNSKDTRGCFLKAPILSLDLLTRLVSQLPAACKTHSLHQKPSPIHFAPKYTTRHHNTPFAKIKRRQNRWNTKHQHQAPYCPINLVGGHSAPFHQPHPQLHQLPTHQSRLYNAPMCNTSLSNARQQKEPVTRTSFLDRETQTSRSRNPNLPSSLI